MRFNAYHQPIGDLVENFTEGKKPNIETIFGQSVRIEKVKPSHFEDLFEIYGDLSTIESFTYLSFDRFKDEGSFQKYFQMLLESCDPYYLSIIDNTTNKAVGTFALMRIDSINRVIEMGWVVYSSWLKRTKMATEAQYLMMKYVFETLQYRRYEWKCDSLNAPSRKAAERLGFTFEGTFRQALVYKGRNRDTSWYSMLDVEWPEKKRRLETWLDDANFDSGGNQIKSLREL